MDLIHARCAGLDVHKKTVVACVRLIGPDGRVDRQVRTYRTMTTDLIALADWLDACGVTHVAMESTGVYWKPVFHLLEGRFEVLLVNARHMKQVPGRKTDVKDAEWIAQLLQYGLLRASFIPPPPVRDLRDLTRQRVQLVRERAGVVNRIQKVLEDANIKLSSVATDVLGASGRAMLGAIVEGRDDPAALAGMARGSLRGKVGELTEALRGLVSDHHRFLLRTLLRQVDQLEGLIAEYVARIDAVMAAPQDGGGANPLLEAAARLESIPGLGERAAEVIVAEIGPDMAAFPTAGHLASWAGLCPGNNESAGRRQTGKTTKGSQWLRTVMTQVAWSASHTKETIFSATYRRWAKRLGKKKALVALAHKILVVIYTLLKNQTTYEERWTAPDPV
jgi:transposase